MTFADLIAVYGDKYVTALFTTWQMTVISFVGCMVLGLVITILRVCPIRPARVFADFYVQIFRNIPGISLLIICVYALPKLDIMLSYYTAVIIATILIASAFASENFMSGINTIGLGQIEAARSLGLSFGQMLRRVVIPQSIRSVVLPMTNLLIAVMLTTALASQVPMNPQELTGLVSYINTRDVGGIATFMISALCYFGTSVVLSFVGNYLDKKVRILR